MVALREALRERIEARIERSDDSLNEWKSRLSATEEAGVPTVVGEVAISGLLTFRRDFYERIGELLTPEHELDQSYEDKSQ